MYIVYVDGRPTRPNRSARELPVAVARLTSCSDVEPVTSQRRRRLYIRRTRITRHT